MTPNRRLFWLTVLGMLGAPRTNENVQYLESWASVNENTAAKNNPLATTLQTRDSLPDVYNSAGVQQYRTLNGGALATAHTLANGLYNPIVAALRSGRPYTYQRLHGSAIATSLQTWSGNGYTRVA